MSEKHLLSVGVLLLLSVGHIATSNSGDEKLFQDEIQPQTLEGFINDVDWVFGSGMAIYDANDDEYLVRLYEAQVDNPCTLQSGVDKILITMPNQVGPYALSMDENTVTLVENMDPDPPINHTAMEGIVEVYSVTIDTISAGMAVRVDESNWMNGTFSITICE